MAVSYTIPLKTDKKTFCGASITGRYQGTNKPKPLPPVVYRIYMSKVGLCLVEQPQDSRGNIEDQANFTFNMA